MTVSSICHVSQLCHFSIPYLLYPCCSLVISLFVCIPFLKLYKTTPKYSPCRYLHSMPLLPSSSLFFPVILVPVFVTVFILATFLSRRRLHPPCLNFLLSHPHPSPFLYTFLAITSLCIFVFIYVHISILSLYKCFPITRDSHHRHFSVPFLLCSGCPPTLRLLIHITMLLLFLSSHQFGFVVIFVTFLVFVLFAFFIFIFKHFFSSDHCSYLHSHLNDFPIRSLLFPTSSPSFPFGIQFFVLVTATIISLSSSRVHSDPPSSPHLSTCLNSILALISL